jgi:hypothetical protein
MLGIGLAIGLAAGAGGMYLALERPWRTAARAPEAGLDAGPAVADKPKPKKKRGRGGGDAPEGAPDTRMQWKGDNVEKPPASVDMAESGESRSLDGGEIQGAIDDGGSALAGCVADAVGMVPWSGDITLKLLVAGDGRVAKTRVRGPAFAHDKGLLGCMRQGAARLRFPAVGGWTVVTVPFPVTIE